MLPFIGKAHVAYIPNGKVLGISKLARLVDIYARRLQIQERIGEQVTAFLMKEVGAKGAACVIEAQHLCMRMRGCSKQNSIMVTSSMKGTFLEYATTRNEFMSLIK
jgi:GTP cyclohydrolase I